MEGWFEALPQEGRGDLRIRSGLDGCQTTVQAGLARGATPPAPGLVLTAEGVWRQGPGGDPLHPGRAGRLVLETFQVHTGGAGFGVGRGLAHFRGQLQDRTHRLFPREAGVVDALILARREGLSARTREDLARAGVSHLLAISGFHVGVVAGLLLLVARRMGAGPRRAPLWAAGGVAFYAVLIGAPPAAMRATILIGALALTRVREVPAAPLAGVATPFLLMLLWNPASLASVGFQLSFAGAAGLVVLTPPLRDYYRRKVSEITAGGARGLGLLRAPAALLATPLAAGIAATVATLPLVTWHFHRIPLMGIPATLLLTPLVAGVIPGIGVTLAIEPFLPRLAHFLAGGIELLLMAFARGATKLGAPGWAYPWITREALLLLVGGILLGEIGRRLRRRMAVRTRRSRRPLWWGSGGALLLLLGLWSPVPGTRALEIHVVDVGQGDGLLLRSPRGRWMMVDAGPRTPTFDAGERRMVPQLMMSGGRVVDLLVVTHPHLDHFGGAVSVLAALPVHAIMDPGLAVGSRGFGELLGRAVDREVAWWPARSGTRIDWDGVELTVLHPSGAPVLEGPVPDPNDVSVVLLVRYGAFTALLTGDAPSEVEHRIVEGDGLPSRLTLLKVGHHGSRTSSSALLLDRADPEIALLSLGRGNHFGHPAPEVMSRLRTRGIRIYRTDEHGTVRIRARPDGSVRIIPGRAPAP